MKASFSIVGGQDLAKRLTQLPAAVSKRVQRDALRTAAEPIRDEAARQAPRDAQANAPHLADNIVIGTVSKTRPRADETIVEVGPALQPSDHFYGYFQEYGTAFAPAQPFMRGAFESQVRRSMAIVVDELWASIRKKLGLGGGRSTTGGNL
jgi:HK97 gp10 family phage protein